MNPFSRQILFSVGLAACIVFPMEAQPSNAPSHRATSSEDRYRTWLEQDVVYIITREEKEVFLKLTTPEEKEKFVEQFWLRRDPDPSTPVNEFKEEHYRRIAYVNTYFGSGIPGWKTDRGRVYILYGPPAQIEPHPAGGTYERPRSEGGGTTSTFPFEIWRYRHIEGVGDDVEIEFVDKTLTGKFTIAMDPAEKDALLRIPGAGKTLLEEAGAASKTDRVLGVNQQQAFLRMGQRAKDQPFERLIQNANLQRPPQIRFKELQRLITAKVSYRALPLDLAWDHLWIDDERVLVPVTLTLPAEALSYRSQQPSGMRQASVQFYGRITSISGRIAHEFEEEVSFSPTDRAGSFMLQRQVLLTPGRYRLEIVLKDLVGDKFGTAAAAIVIPTNLQGRTKISSLMLARQIEFSQAPADRLEPFVYGDLRVVPSAGAEFAPGSRLGVYFHVVGPRLKADDPSPVELTYQIHKDGKVVEEVDDQEGSTIHQPGEGRVVAFAFLSLRKLAPGMYTLVVVCKERDGAMVSAAREFRIK